MSNESIKRLFFGVEVHSPWPEKLPLGRVLDPSQRHLTLAFLGDTHFEKIKQLLPSIPLPSFKVGFAGQFDQCLFLPPHHTRVAAWHVEWLENAAPFLRYQQTITEWLISHELLPKQKYPFMPHVTIARAPFKQHEWKETFYRLPLYTQNLHLFESLGDLKYASLWHFPLHPPFIEIEHTADRAYQVYGETPLHIFQHASLALTFEYPSLLPFLSLSPQIETLEDVVIELNHLVARADQEIGVPFKAVSFHGEIMKKEDNLLAWEMIIDV